MATLGACKTCKGKCSSDAPRCPHCGQPSPLSCFAAETLIETPFGSRAICKLREGDVILSFALSSGKTIARLVTARIEHAAAQIFEVQWCEGRPLRTTFLHPLLTRRGWVRAGRLRPGDRIVGTKGVDRVVRETIPTSRIEPVFNLHTAVEHNFIAEGAVAHNFVVMPALRSIIHRLFVDPIASSQAQLVSATGRSWDPQRY